MSNLYEFPNQFRLYDVDGVILDNPNDFIVIHEPIGFSGVDISLSRDDKTHGVFYEFSGAETKLGFDRVVFDGETLSPYILIRALLGTVGVDGVLRLAFYNFDEILNDYVVQYEGDIDLEFNRRLDISIECNVKRVTLGDLFKTRKDVPVNLAAKKTIDGDVITGIEPVEMFLHSKVLPFNQKATSSPADGILSSTNNSGWIVQFDLNQGSNLFEGELDGYDNYLDTSFGGGVVTSLYNSPNTIVRSNYVFEKVIGKLKFDFTSNYRMNFDNNVNMGSFHYGTFVKINGEEFQIDAGTGAHVGGIAMSVRIYRVITDIEFDIPENAEVAIYDKWDLTGSLDPSFVWHLRSGSTLQPSDDLFEALFTSVTANSFADVYSPIDVFNQILEVTTNETSIFESDFFTDYGNVIKLTNGYKIRRFVNKNVIASFKEMFTEWAQTMFGLGYTVYESSPDVFSIKMERYEFFYQDVEIDFFETIIDGSFILEIDKDVISNEFNTGYKDYPKSTDENTQNNLDEFNTEQHSLTPIRSVKKKTTYKSSSIGSGYKTENQRREQFKDNPNGTVSDDDKLFCIDSVDNDTYVTPTGSEITVQTNQTEGTLSLLGTYFDVRVGDTINIDVSGGFGSIDGDYDITGVSIVGNKTVCSSLDVTSIASTMSEVTITLPENRLRAARDENFEFVDNVISPETSYNVGLNPKYMLKNHALIFNSGFNPKPDTDLITTQEAKLNDLMSCQFKSGEGLYNVDPQTIVEMGGDMPLSDVASYTKLFSGEIIKFKTNIGYDRVLKIRDAMLNQSLLSDNFGYIRVKDYEGNERTGFLKDMTYNPLTQEVSFVLKGRFVPNGLSFDYTLDSPIN